MTFRVFRDESWAVICCDGHHVSASVISVDVTESENESPCASWASTGIALAIAGPSKTPRPKEASLEGLAVPAPHSGSEAPCPGA